MRISPYSMAFFYITLLSFQSVYSLPDLTEKAYS